MSHFLKDTFENPAVLVLGGLGICGAGVSTYFAWNKIKDVNERRRLRQLIQRKQKERTEAFAKLRYTYKLNSDRKYIVELPVEDLLEKLQTRELGAMQVLEAYIAKALEATDAFNCVTEFVPQALTWAKELDTLPNPVGPLHGLPVAIKDDTDIEGMDSTLGYGANLYKPATSSSVFVRAIRELGAVPFCKTNVPQTLLSGSEGHNPIFGVTTNPLNPALAPGGSSSGSGCIVGAGAAPVAEGTDLGGSGRIPAHWCGTASIKPTMNRLSAKGIVQAVTNVMGVFGVPCVMAMKSKTVATVFQALTDNYRQNQLDPLACPIPWREEIFASTRPLRIGYFTSVPLFPAMGDTESVVLNAKKALESLGHTLVPLKLPDSYHYGLTASNLYLADEGKYVLGRLKHEDVSPVIKPTIDGLKMSRLTKRVLSFLFGQPWLPFMYSKRIHHLSQGGAHESWQLWEAYGERRKIIAEILDQMESNNLDLILGPVFPCAAVKHCDLSALFAYPALWNLVDFPAGVVRFGKESGTKFDQFDNEGDLLLKLAHNEVKDSVGMPIGVTLVGKPFQEELILRAMVELESQRANP